MEWWISFDKKTFIFIPVSLSCKSFRCTVQLVSARFRWAQGWNTTMYLMWGITETRGWNAEAGKHNGKLICMWLGPGILAGQCGFQKLPEHQGLPGGWCQVPAVRARAASGICRSPSPGYQTPPWGQGWTKPEQDLAGQASLGASWSGQTEIWGPGERPHCGIIEAGTTIPLDLIWGPGPWPELGSCRHWAKTDQESFGYNCKNWDAKSENFLI